MGACLPLGLLRWKLVGASLVLWSALDDGVEGLVVSWLSEVSWVVGPK